VAMLIPTATNSIALPLTIPMNVCKNFRRLANGAKITKMCASFAAPPRYNKGNLRGYFHAYASQGKLGTLPGTLPIFLVNNYL
jgi:hypothetical protein